MRALRWFAAALWLAHPNTSLAKEVGFRSLGGREIYDSNDEFAQVTQTQQRQFVIEAAVGAGPEGNLAVLLGWLNKPIRRLDWYAGFGVEVNPALHYTFGARYTFEIDGYRPYVGAGYLYHDLYALRTYSHNAFAELGYTWIVHDTYRLSAGAGVRYMIHLGIREDSPLKDADVDPQFLEEQRQDVTRWLPTLALRFSRAF